MQYHRSQVRCCSFSFRLLRIKTSNLINLIKQMKPSSIPGGVKMNSSQAKLFQDWQCPKGTIPIRREQEDECPRPRGVKWIPRRTQHNHSFYDNRRHEVYSCHTVFSKV